MSCHCSISVPPETIRKPEVFWCFLGVYKKTSGMKWIKNSYHIVTSPLICRGNYWTGFNVIGTSVIKGWKGYINQTEDCVHYNIFERLWTWKKKDSAVKKCKNQLKYLEKREKKVLTHFQPMFHFYAPWKNRIFSDVFRGYRSGTLVENRSRLMKFVNLATSMESWFSIVFYFIVQCACLSNHITISNNKI